MLITFFITWKIFKISSLPRGFVFYSVILVYSIFRFMTDFLRDQGTWLFGLTNAQYFAIIFGLISGYMLLKLGKAYK